MITHSEYLEYMKKGKYHPRVKIQWLRKDESVESEFTSDLIDFSFSSNLNNGVRESVDMKIRNLDGTYIPNPNNLWINQKFKLYTGYHIDGEDKLFLKGIFICNNPSISSKGSESIISINATDKASLYNGQNGGNLPDIHIIPVDTNLNTAINTLMTDAGEVKSTILQATSIVTPYTLRIESSKTRWDIIKELAEALSRDVFFDIDGHLKMRQIRLDANKPSVWDYNYGEERFTYLSSNHNYEWDKVYNSQTVIGDNIDGHIVKGVAENRDLASPICIQKIGYRPAEPIENTVIQTDHDAQELAKYKLRRSIRVNESIAISCIYIPHLQVDDVITITDKNLKLHKERFIINSISGNIRSGITVNATKFTDIDIVIS